MTVRNAEIELGYCRMYAPIDGRISRINYHVGNLVGDGQATLLATIVKIDPIYAYTTSARPTCSGSERWSARPAGRDGRAQDADGAGPGRRDRVTRTRGRVDYQDPAVDPGTGTVRMRGIFPNPEA